MIVPDGVVAALVLAILIAQTLRSAKAIREGELPACPECGAPAGVPCAPGCAGGGTPLSPRPAIVWPSRQTYTRRGR